MWIGRRPGSLPRRPGGSSAPAPGRRRWRGLDVGAADEGLGDRALGPDRDVALVPADPERRVRLLDREQDRRGAGPEALDRDDELLGEAGCRVDVDGGGRVLGAALGQALGADHLEAGTSRRRAPSWASGAPQATPRPRTTRSTSRTSTVSSCRANRREAYQNNDTWTAAGLSSAADYRLSLPARRHVSRGRRAGEGGPVPFTPEMAAMTARNFPNDPGGRTSCPRPPAQETSR